MLSRKQFGRAALWVIAVAGAAPVPANRSDAQGVNVWTYHNDNARTGQNLNEKLLKHKSVRENLGKLRTLDVDVDVDVDVYAQPLFLSGVPFRDPAGVVAKHDVVYVATQNDSVYAFDADTGAQLGRKSLLADPGASAIAIDPTGEANPFPGKATDIAPKIGIIGTPVIDVNAADIGNSTLYVVSKYRVTAGTSTSFVQRLNALDVASLEHRANSPGAPIRATYPGTGDGRRPADPSSVPSDNDGHGQVVFDPLLANQRAGLLLLDGVVYACWASHGDNTPYHGWVIGFDATTLKPVAVYNATPNGGQGGIWHAGAAPAADSRGFIYLSTGNGTFDGRWDPADGALVPGTLDARGFPIKANYGDSIIKLVPDLVNGRLKVVDYFAPYRQEFLDDNDLDQGAGGIVILPDRREKPQHRMVTASKDGVIYLLDCDDLGKFSAPGNPNPVVSRERVLQRIPNNPRTPPRSA